MSPDRVEEGDFLFRENFLKQILSFLTIAQILGFPHSLHASVYARGHSGYFLDIIYLVKS